MAVDLDKCIWVVIFFIGAIMLYRFWDIIAHALCGCASDPNGLAQCGRDGSGGGKDDEEKQMEPRAGEILPSSKLPAPRVVSTCSQLTSSVHSVSGSGSAPYRDLRFTGLAGTVKN